MSEHFVTFRRDASAKAPICDCDGCSNVYDGCLMCKDCGNVMSICGYCYRSVLGNPDLYYYTGTFDQRCRITCYNCRDKKIESIV